MKLSDELIQGVALGDALEAAVDEQMINAWAQAEDEAQMGLVEKEKRLTITFPAHMNMSREDFDRMKAEIQAMLQQAELRGEQKALAKISEGRGIMEGLDSLIQASQDEWQAYQDEHFATGDGAPRSET